jgi:hypothetical protein
MFYIKGIAPAFMNATALEYTTKEEADEALAAALANLGNVSNKLEVVEE